CTRRQSRIETSVDFRPRGRPSVLHCRQRRRPSVPRGASLGKTCPCLQVVTLSSQRFFTEVPLKMALKRVAIPSPNYSSRGGSSVRIIVLHTAEGATTIESLGSYFASTSSGVSSHTGIDDKKGVIGEYVQRQNKAWTAANANPVAVQTELCAFAKWSSNQWSQHPNMLDNCAQWIAEESKAFGIPITKLTAQQAQGSGCGICQHSDLGSWGGGHW